MVELARQLLLVTEEDMKIVRAHYNKSQKDIDKECEIIKMWMKQQRHFPDDYDRLRVERIHLRNKFRMERTKEKLEKYYTAKGDNPAYFKNLDPEKEYLQTALITVTWMPLPKMNRNLERVYLSRFIGNDHLYSLDLVMVLCFALAELEMVHDYSIGVRIIFDMKGISMTHYTKMDVNTAAKALFIFQQGLSGRLLGFEFLNAPSFMNLILGIFKLAFPPKLYNKIRVHADFDSLKTIIDEECLPSDYGGRLRSSDEINEDVKIALSKNRNFLLFREKMISDESKRVGEVKKNDLFGVDGTFKKINLD